MSTPIEQNTTALEELLGIAESLPDRGNGGGGGGLPGGISKIATGTFTSTEDVTSAMVDHGLGEIPTFLVWVAESDLSSPQATFNILGAIVRKVHAINSTTKHKLGYFFRGYNANNSAAGAQNSGASSIYMTDTQCRLCGNSSYQFLAGYEYRWVAGVIDGIE